MPFRWSIATSWTAGSGSKTCTATSPSNCSGRRRNSSSPKCPKRRLRRLSPRTSRRWKPRSPSRGTWPPWPPAPGRPPRIGSVCHQHVVGLVPRHHLVARDAVEHSVHHGPLRRGDAPAPLRLLGGSSMARRAPGPPSARLHEDPAPNHLARLLTPLMPPPPRRKYIGGWRSLTAPAYPPIRCAGGTAPDISNSHTNSRALRAPRSRDTARHSAHRAACTPDRSPARSRSGWSPARPAPRTRLLR